MSDTTTSTIVWADPPPKAGGPGSVGSTFPRATEDALRAHPGRWALVAKGTPGPVPDLEGAGDRLDGHLPVQCPGAETDLGDVLTIG